MHGPSVEMAIPGNLLVCVALQCVFTCSGNSQLSFPATTMLGADIAVCHWYGMFAVVLSHLQKVVVLRMAIAWVCLPARIICELWNTRYLPWFFETGIVLMRWCLHAIPFLNNVYGARLREHGILGLRRMP